MHINKHTLSGLTVSNDFWLSYEHVFIHSIGYSFNKTSMISYGIPSTSFGVLGKHKEQNWETQILKNNIPSRGEYKRNRFLNKKLQIDADIDIDEDVGVGTCTNTDTDIWYSIVINAKK